MSYVKIILHCVWSTKNRQPSLIDKNQREALFAHICTNARKKGILVNLVGGYIDHIHLLLLQNKEQAPSKTLQLIKGEASHWFNQQYGKRLEWQDDYFIVSIGESQVTTVSNYILKQEEHHRHKSYQEECDEFMRAYNFKRGSE